MKGASLLKMMNSEEPVKCKDGHTKFSNFTKLYQRMQKYEIQGVH